MKRHNEDLWDFRSDHNYDNDKKTIEDIDTTQDLKISSDQAEEEAEYAEYTEEYVGILRSKAALDTSLDDLTFVMKDGKASWIEPSAPKEEPKPVAKAAKKEKKPAPSPILPKEQPTEKESNAQIAPTEEQIASPSHAEITPIISEETTSKDTDKTENTEKTTTKDIPIATDNSSSAISDDAIASNVSSPTSDSSEAEDKSVKAESNSAIEEKETAQEDKTADIDIFPVPVKKQKLVADSYVNEKATAESINSNTSAPRNNSASKGTPTKSTKKGPATDNDFILAKPHSKKKHHSHHSHSHSHTHTHNENSELPAENVDDYIYARYRKQSSKSRKHHKKKSSTAEYIHTQDNEATPVVCSTTAGHYRAINKRKKKDRKWHRRPWWQKLLIILGWITGVLLVLALIAFILFLIFSRVGLDTMTDYDTAKIAPPKGVEVKVEDDEVLYVYNGKKYRLNTDIANILCFGVDKQNINENNLDEGLAGVGQNDALFMVALNTETGKTTVISIPRNTMTDINILNKNGNLLSTEKRQISMAFAYGDGKYSSCENTINAVSKLFYQLPIQTYFAMDLSAIAPLNNEVGGVTVKLKSDFVDSNNKWHYAGETLTLWDDHARKYLQYRDVYDPKSTSDRLDRQVGYLKTFTSKVLSKTKNDLTFPIDLYNIVSPKSLSNLDVYKISALARCLIENGITDLEFVTLPGKLMESSDFNTPSEYIVNEDSFWELWLKTYCEPVK